MLSDYAALVLCNLVTARSAANSERCPGNSVNLYTVRGTPEGRCGLVYIYMPRHMCNKPHHMQLH